MKLDVRSKVLLVLFANMAFLFRVSGWLELIIVSGLATLLYFAEKGKIAVRNVRRDAMDTLKRQEKDGDITEDEQRSLEKQVQKVTDDATKEIDKLADQKSQEITQG